jgi:predicted nucleic acid-binding Zn ribbon protein
MRRLGDALPHALRSLGIARRTREAQALWLWPQLLGPYLSQESRALRLSGGTLWVTATSTALAHQLSLERGRLTDALNQAIGARVVREIRFRQVQTFR